MIEQSIKIYYINKCERIKTIEKLEELVWRENESIRK
jgi:hypothetical protein